MRPSEIDELLEDVWELDESQLKFFGLGEERARPEPLPRTTVGLERMRDRTPDGSCPFCLEPLAATLSGKTAKSCGAVECERAYMKVYQRDRRRGLRVRDQRAALGGRQERDTETLR